MHAVVFTVTPAATHTPAPTDTVVATPTRTSTATQTSTRTVTATVTATPAWAAPGPDCAPRPGPAVLKLNVPYIQQVTDIDGADGNWACGPTSVAMVLAYYGKLDPWSDYLADIAANQVKQGTPAAASGEARLVLDNGRKPSATPLKGAATSDGPAADYAPYITNVYTNNGHTYNSLGSAPGGSRLAGLYGTICPSGLADWGRMVQVFQWHGLTSRHIGTGWNDVVAALKKGHPVLIGNDLTPDGHILVAVGYTNNRHLLVNDPYGNRFLAGYGGTSGENVFYRFDCMRIKSALEVIGTYPPPPRPTRTPLPAGSQGQVPAAAAVVAAGQAVESGAAITGFNPTHRVQHDDGQDGIWPGQESKAADSGQDNSTGNTRSPGREQPPASTGSDTHKNRRADQSAGWWTWMLPSAAALVFGFGLYAVNRKRLQPVLAQAEQAVESSEEA